MSRRQLPRAPAAQLDAATFLPGEVVVDTTNDELRYDGDGSTVGGIALARKDGSNLTASAALVTATGSSTSKTLADWMATLIGASIFTSGDATPSVLNGIRFITAGSTTITNFDDGVDGQIIAVHRGSADIVIQDNASIETMENANITLDEYQPCAYFRRSSGVWKQFYPMGLGRITAAPGDNIPYRWDFGANAGTSFPSFRIGGPSRGGATMPALFLFDAGDTSDVYWGSVDGTASSPTTWTGYRPYGQLYSKAPLITTTMPIDNVTHIGRHFMVYGGQTQTPTATAQGGWVSLGATRNNEIVPWQNAWFTGEGVGRGLFLPGRSNVAGEEARATDGGALLTYPYNYSNVAKNAFSAGGINPSDSPALGNIHTMASDNSVAFAAWAIRFNDAWTYGFDWATDHANDTLILFPVASGSRGSNAIEFDNDGNIRPLVDGGSDAGTASLKFGVGYFKQGSFVPTSDVNALHVHAANNSYTNDVALLQCNTAAGTSFNFLKATADADGSPSNVFVVSGAGAIVTLSTIDIGHASDTTLSRLSAGVLGVEGKTVATLSTAQTWTAAQTFNAGAALGDGSELTIAAGVITATGSYHTVDTEADAATDDLDTITNPSEFRILVIRAQNSGRTVVAKDGTGNLFLAGDFSLDNNVDTLMLLGLPGTGWIELGRSDNAA